MRALRRPNRPTTNDWPIPIYGRRTIRVPRQPIHSVDGEVTRHWDWVALHERWSNTRASKQRGEWFGWRGLVQAAALFFVVFLTYTCRKGHRTYRNRTTQYGSLKFS